MVGGMGREEERDGADLDTHDKLVPVLLVSTAASSPELHLLPQHWIACMGGRGNGRGQGREHVSSLCESLYPLCSGSLH